MNDISKLATIGKNVKLGDNNIISPFVIIHDNVEIGDNNYIASGVAIGNIPRQILKPYKWEKPIKTEISTICKVKIGSNCAIYENTVIHNAVLKETVIGNDVVIGSLCHIGHDTIIHDNVIIASSVKIGGFNIIEKASNIGLGVSIHQRSVVGTYSMIGMNCTVKGYIPPFIVVAGIPARFIKVNVIGLVRNGLNTEMVSTIKNYVSNPFQNSDPFISDIRSNFQSNCEKFKRIEYPLNVLEI